DGCPGASVEMEGRPGVFLQGAIIPPLSGVDISITSGPGDQEGAKTNIRVLTDDQGRYRVGPLHGGIEYSLDAQKNGFIITPIPERKGHFQAFKLGEINIKVRRSVEYRNR
ncbi:predicted protein, partial [Nematostella vectensis]